jgi:hypothetical protein
MQTSKPSGPLKAQSSGLPGASFLWVVPVPPLGQSFALGDDALRRTYARIIRIVTTQQPQYDIAAVVQSDRARLRNTLLGLNPAEAYSFTFHAV